MEKNYTQLAKELNNYLASEGATVWDEAICDNIDDKCIIVRSKDYDTSSNSVIAVEDVITFASYHHLSATVAWETTKNGTLGRGIYPCIHLS